MEDERRGRPLKIGGVFVCICEPKRDDVDRETDSTESVCTWCSTVPHTNHSK